MAMKKLSLGDAQSMGLEEVEGHFIKESEPFRSEDAQEIQAKLKELVEAGEVSQEDIDQVTSEGDLIRLWSDDGGNWMVMVVTPNGEPMELSLKASPVEPVDLEWPSEETLF